MIPLLESVEWNCTTMDLLQELSISADHDVETGKSLEMSDNVQDGINPTRKGAWDFGMFYRWRKNFLNFLLMMFEDGIQKWTFGFCAADDQCEYMMKVNI